MDGQFVYFYDGEKLQSQNLQLSKIEKGIFGIFSVETHATEPNTMVFYRKVDARKEFHHPTKRGYEYQNWGFQEFLKEQLDAKWVSGGKSGLYKIANQILLFDLDCGTTHIQRFKPELIKRNLARKIVF